MAESDPVALMARLVAVFEADQARADADTHQRDADIGRRLSPDLDDNKRIQRWLQEVSPSLNHGMPSSVSTTGAMIVLGGALIGLLSAATLFYYDGSGRVNALAVIGMLVGFPTLLLAASWASCLSITRARVWPLLGGLLGALARLSPGRLTGWLAARISRGDVEHISLLAPNANAGAHATAAQPTMARVRLWFYVRWAHLGSVGFFVGALTAMLALVVFTDLVFGWSTTLDMSDADMLSVVQLLALPWAWLWPDALPGADLVAASRYYRAAEPIQDVGRLAELGQWWPFLSMCVLTYGALPRVLSAVVCQVMLGRAARAGITEHPQSVALLRRLQVVAAAAEVQARESGGLSPPASRPKVSRLRADRIVNWAQVPINDDELRAFFGATSVLHAGGTRSISEDEEVIAAIANSPQLETTIVSKAWEPPILDLADFASDLHAVVEASVAVVPVSVNQGQPAAAGDTDSAVWRRSFSVADVALNFVPETAA